VWSGIDSKSVFSDMLMNPSRYVISNCSVLWRGFGGCPCPCTWRSSRSASACRDLLRRRCHLHWVCWRRDCSVSIYSTFSKIPKSIFTVETLHWQRFTTLGHTKAWVVMKRSFFFILATANWSPIKTSHLYLSYFLAETSELYLPSILELKVSV